MIITDPAVRRWLYGIIAAAIPVLVIAGVIGPDDVQVWLNLAAAILGLGAAGLAIPNTPVPPGTGKRRAEPEPFGEADKL